MNDKPNAHYVTKKELAGHASVIWMYIMLILISIILGDDQVFPVVLFIFSFIGFVWYMLIEKPLFRRKRRPKE